MSNNIVGEADPMQERTKPGVIAVTVYLTPRDAAVLDELCSDWGFTYSEAMAGLLAAERETQENRIWSRRRQTGQANEARCSNE